MKYEADRKDASKIEWLNGLKPSIKELWYLGEWRENLFIKAAAVIGARQITQYGRRVVEMLIPRLVEDGWTIVSGGMYGVDEAAHRATIACGGTTIGVLGWGIRQEVEPLGKDILDAGGVLLSEWEQQKGALWTFPARNRIVAAMCQRIYVVEAGIKSGSMITVNWAQKLGKEIWAVPGPITSTVSAGTNLLIAEGIAKIWLPDNSVNRSTNNTDISTLLQNEPLTIDELARSLHKQIDVLSYELMQLQLQGVVEEREGKYFFRGV